MKLHKIEFYPDRVGDGPDGPCALVLEYRKPSSKRFDKMTDAEKTECREIISIFERSLKALKKSIK